MATKVTAVNNVIHRHCRMESTERVTGTGHPLTGSDVEIPSTPPDHGTRRLVRNDKNRTWTLNNHKKVMCEFYKARAKESTENIARTGHPLTGSDVKIPSTHLDLSTKRCVQNGGNKRAETRRLSIVINKDVMYGHNKAWTKERGFLKRMVNDWKSRDNFDCAQKQLAHKKKNISDKNLLMESGLQTMPDEVQHDSPKEESEKPPTGNDVPQDVSYHSFKMESTENTRTGHLMTGSDVEILSTPPDRGTRCSGLNEGNNRTWTYNVNDYYKVMYELYKARPKESTESIAGTGHPLTGSNVNIPSTSPDPGTRGCVQKGKKNRTWTHTYHKELMYCYYKARPMERGFRKSMARGFWKRMEKEWKTRGNFNCSRKLLAHHKKYILDNNRLTESELLTIRDKAQHDLLNEESEKTATENDGPPNMSYYRFKMESSESIAETGHPTIGSDGEIASTSPDVGARNCVRNGYIYRRWTHNDDKELMYCYYKARPKEKGFQKRMANEWKTRGNFNCSEEQLASHKKYILEKNKMTESVLQTIRDKVQHDSHNEQLDKPATRYDGPHDLSYHHFKMELSESIAGTGDPLTKSDVEILLAPPRDLGSRRHVRNGYILRRWTHNDDKELMYCYYKARPKEKGYLKRMAKEWKTRGNFDCSYPQLASHKRYILNNNLLTKSELQAIQDRIQHDSTNEDSEKSPRGNDGPHDVSYHPFKVESSDSIAGTGDPLKESDVEILSFPPDRGGRSHVRNGYVYRFWTRNDNKELIYCYYKARPKEKGFWKRMAKEWKTRGNFDCSYQQLARHKRYILNNDLLTEFELQTIQDRVQHDSPNEVSEKPPTGNDGLQEDLEQEAPNKEFKEPPTENDGLHDVSYHHFKIESSESIAETGDLMTGSDVDILSTPPDQGTRRHFRNGYIYRMWACNDNKELMYCYYKARPKEKGFWKRMAKEWKTRGNFDCSGRQLVRHKKYILDNNLLTESELQKIRRKVRDDSTNEELEEPPTGDKGPQDLSYHHFKMESNESIAGRGDPMTGSDVDILLTPPRDLGNRSHVRSGYIYRRWTYNDNKELMYCFYKARPKEKGFLKRMAKEWKTRGNFDCSQTQLKSHKRYILNNNLLTESELQTMRDRIQHDSPTNEESEKPPTENDGPQEDQEQSAEEGPEQAAQEGLEQTAQEGPEQAAQDGPEQTAQEGPEQSAEEDPEQAAEDPDDGAEDSELVRDSKSQRRGRDNLGLIFPEDLFQHPLPETDHWTNNIRPWTSD